MTSATRFSAAVPADGAMQKWAIATMRNPHRNIAHSQTIHFNCDGQVEPTKQTHRQKQTPIILNHLRKPDKPKMNRHFAKSQRCRDRSRPAPTAIQTVSDRPTPLCMSSGDITSSGHRPPMQHRLKPSDSTPQPRQPTPAPLPVSTRAHSPLPEHTHTPIALRSPIPRRNRLESRQRAKAVENGLGRCAWKRA